MSLFPKKVECSFKAMSLRLALCTCHKWMDFSHKLVTTELMELTPWFLFWNTKTHVEYSNHFSSSFFQVPIRHGSGIISWRDSEGHWVPGRTQSHRTEFHAWYLICIYVYFNFVSVTVIYKWHFAREYWTLVIVVVKCTLIVLKLI